MKIIDQTQDFPGDGWCVVVMDRQWPNYTPLAVFPQPDLAREWLQDEGDEKGSYALHAVPFATPKRGN